MRIIPLITSLAVILPLTVFADDPQHSLAAHVHGVATLNIALEDQQLELQLTSPAMNMVGFEYQPISAADKQAAAEAQTKLNNPAALFNLTATAQCSLTSLSIDHDWLENSDQHGHQHEEEAHAADHQHSDVSAHYHYRCATPAALNSIDLAGFFKQFARTEHIQVQLISAEQQLGVELSHKDTQINW